MQWQQSATGTSGWADITGATSASYTTSALSATTWYRAIVTSGVCSSATSGTVKITVGSAFSAGTVSANQTLCKGNTVSISTTGATGNLQWQQSANNTTWADINGATSATYTSSALNATTYYRVVATSGACTPAISAAITVTVDNPASAGTISGGQTTCAGNTLTLTATGTSGSLQWQQSANGSDWANVTGGSGATTASYTTAPVLETTHFRLVATGGTCGSATSNTATVTIIENEWTGNVNTDWHVDGNWTCGIPTLAQNVTIPQRPNQPVVMASLTALGKTLNIQSGAVVTVNAMNNMHVAGSITVAATGNMIVNSTGNLLQDGTTNANTGKITVKRDSSPLYRQDYTLWSSPVAGQGVFQFSPQTLANRFYTYDTAQDLYAAVPNLSAQSATTFTPGVGYLIRMPNANAAPGYNGGTAAIVHNGSFTGVPNSGNISVPVSLDLNRYNGVGNPYPSAINIWDFIDANSALLEQGTLYFWRKKNNNNNTTYAAITKFTYSENRAEGGDTGSATFVDGQQASWVINTGQGFLVKVKTGTSHVVFSNSMRRLVNNTQFFRNGSQAFSSSKFRLNLTSASGEFGQAVIGYSNATTHGFDYGWDGVLLNDGSVAVYTATEGTNLAIQAKGEFTADDVVAVSYRVTTPGSYTLKLKQPDGIFAAQQDIYLKDNVTGTTYDIKGGDYTFTTKAGTFANRFEVVYMAGTMGVKNQAAASANIIIYKDAAGLHIDGGSQMLSNIQLFDIRGRLVHEEKNVNATAKTITGLRAEQQVLIVQVTTAEGAVTSKKVIF